MKYIFKYLFLLFIFSNINSLLFSQITIDKTNYTTEQLVKEILISGSIEISNIKFTGNPDAIGYFSGGEVGICFESGIILSTGDVKNAKGPNDSNNTYSTFDSGSDVDLEKLVAGHYTTDAAVLEFDFIPKMDSVRFQYIFASEEYPEYVEAGYNDVFAFFLSGKNPKGGNYNNLNIALVPETSTPVTIDNVNSFKNSKFYTDNSGGKNIEYDGLTTTLTAQAVVIKGEKYHIKIAICDVGDGNYDSGVFLKATSFYGGSTSTFENVCLGSATKFTLSNPSEVDSCVWNFGDTDSGAKNISSEKNPTHLFSKAGDFEVKIISYYNSLADTVLQKITIVGNKVELGQDISLKSEKSVVLDAGNGGISYLWSTGETTQTITVTNAGTYSVEVTFAEGCVAKDSVVVKIGNKPWLALILSSLVAIGSLILFLICRRKNARNN